MSRPWTNEELETASKWMESHGWMSYKEFCRRYPDGFLTITDGTTENMEAGDQL